MSLQGTNFITKKCWLLKTLEGLMPFLYPKLHCCFPSELRNPADFQAIILLQAPFPFSPFAKTNLGFYPSISHENPHFHTFPFFPFFKIPLTRLKNPSLPYRNPSNPLKIIRKPLKSHFLWCGIKPPQAKS